MPRAIEIAEFARVAQARQSIVEAVAEVQTSERVTVGPGLDMLPEEYDRDRVQFALESLVSDVNFALTAMPGGG